MKLNLALLLICSFVFVDAQQTAPLSLSISTERSDYKVGEPIVIGVVLENSSAEPISVVYARERPGHAEMTYKVDRLEGHGALATRTRYGRTLRGETQSGGAFKSFAKKVLQPHEKLADTLVLTDLYELAQPGPYVIQLEKDRPNSKIISNAIKVTIQ